MRLFVCRLERMLLLLAAARVSHMFPPRVKLHPHKIYASGGGLLMAPINAPQLRVKHSNVAGLCTQYSLSISTCIVHYDNI